MIITLPAETVSFLGPVAVSLLFGWMVWICVWLWLGGEPTSPIPLAAWGVTSVLAWLFGTGKIVVRVAPR